MQGTNLRGPFKLNRETILKEVPYTRPGCYVLGYTKNNDSFVVQYVGRSDYDVADRLGRWAGNKYREFKFRYFDSPKAAFDRECNIYHDFGGARNRLDNKSHPDRPDGTGWKCPKCSIFR